MFEGQGSFGNGAAMRVAPVGAYFAGDIGAVVEQAARSSVITHTHDEAIAGSIAVAVAAAQLTQCVPLLWRPADRSFSIWFYLMFLRVKCAAKFGRRGICCLTLLSSLLFQFWGMA